MQYLYDDDDYADDDAGKKLCSFSQAIGHLWPFGCVLSNPVLVGLVQEKRVLGQLKLPWLKYRYDAGLRDAGSCMLGIRDCIEKALNIGEIQDYDNNYQTAV